MSRVFEADCIANIVKIEGKPIVDAVVISEGIGQSDGVALMQGSEVYYITSNATDIKALITNMGAILDQISIILTGLDAVSTSPGSVTAGIAALAILKVQLALTKESLK